MSPSKPALSSQMSQSKKQASISSFFAPKTNVSKAIVPRKPKNVSHINGHGKTHEVEAENLFVSSENKATSVRTIATTLGKRQSDHSDSDVENHAPGAKRRRSNVVEDDDDSELHGADSDREPYDAAVRSPACQPPEKSNAEARTSKYLFSSSPLPDEAFQDAEDEELQRYKKRMHERFVRKLVKPDAIAEIKRRNNPDTEAVEGEDEDQDEEQSASKPAKAKKPGGARANGKLTPMEQQYLDIKRKHLDTIIIYQVGYKYRIFGEDARIAAKELSFFLIPGKFRYDEHPSEAQWSQFAACSFPLVSLNTHVKRLVAAGHKVGVVKQIETAALKAVGDNRNAPFIRKLTNVYTKGTYVDDIEILDTTDVAIGNNAPSTGYLLCMTESNARGWGTDEQVHVGIIAVQPATGSIIYDDFEDGFMRSEIETRLLHIAPCEYLIVGDVSAATDKLVKHLSQTKANVFGDQARLERVEKPKTMAAQAYSHISNFYAEKLKSGGDRSQDERKSHTLDKIHQLTEHVTICLSAMIKHLTEYGLEHIFDLTRNFQSFSARTHMLINGNTLNSLEIYRNQTDHSEKGSLLWTLDRTKTKFGKRMLRGWIGRPLLNKEELEKRIDAVEELLQGISINVDRLKSVVSSAKGDLEKVLIRIYYKKAARSETLGFLQTLQSLANHFSHVKGIEDGGFRSAVLNDAVVAIPRMGDVVVDFLERINAQSAKENNKYSFFREEHDSEEVQEHTMGIAAVEHELEQHRSVAGQKLGKKKVDYITVAQTEYLIEVLNDKASLKKVPASWIKISNTKKASRFHTPEVIKMLKERDQHREALAAACDDAYNAFLGEISTHYQGFRECIQSLAVVDCLLSLAEVSAQPGYVKPTFSSSPHILVSQGRHPMVERLLLDSYVPNDIQLSAGTSTPPTTENSPATPNALLITGPNMGGKSSYVRSVALIAIMGQIGCYVPAASAELGILDAVFTRMGAFDNMMRGESTFMVELSETADILKQATPRSLVILDELGRGTSTHDGVAIAEAVLREMISRGIMTLFITHYQDMARLASSCKGLKNVHMRFTENEGAEKGDDEITFLYEVGEGVAHRSYGLNVARLANVPESVIDVASIKSKELEAKIERNKSLNLSRMVVQLVHDSDEESLDRLVSAIEHL